MLSKLKKLLKFRIKRWHVAMRGWDEKDARVLICLEDTVWYWAVLEWLFWDVQTLICHYSDWVKLPGFVRRWKRVWNKEWSEEPTTFEEYYGDSIHSLWHCGVCDPLIQWVWEHKNHFQAYPQWELTLDEARSQFAHDPEVWQWVERVVEEHKAWDAEKASKKPE